jgi:ubiquinone/menaquinone biosynthesis C-methylase UbiE
MKLSESELQELAAQLKKPTGQNAIEVANGMQASNANIISKAIAAINPQPGDRILEIGPGSASHITVLPESVHYTGLDISPEMVALAQQTFATRPNTAFLPGNGTTLPFPDKAFDKVFSVNTLYFWQEPKAYAAEIARVLQPGGLLCLGFIPQSTMQHIPFAKYGFTHYTQQEAAELLESVGFIIQGIDTTTETITGNAGNEITREISILTTIKP